MCRHKLYQILSKSKNVPCLNVLYYTGQNRSVLKFSNGKVHHFKFIQGHYAKSILAIIPGLYFRKNFIVFFFLFLICINQFYITKFHTILTKLYVGIVYNRP